MGVVHAEGAQIAFLDTPGLHKPEHLLNRRMVRAAVETLEEADVLYMLWRRRAFRVLGMCLPSNI